jgi:hypothetical protein
MPSRETILMGINLPAPIDAAGATSDSAAVSSAHRNATVIACCCVVATAAPQLFSYDPDRSEPASRGVIGHEQRPSCKIKSASGLSES